VGALLHEAANYPDLYIRSFTVPVTEMRKLSQAEWRYWSHYVRYTLGDTRFLMYVFFLTKHHNGVII